MLPNIVNEKPDVINKCCYDCKYCKCAVSWWCCNDKAVKLHNSAIPNYEHCEFWEPAETTIWFKIKNRIIGEFDNERSESKDN